MTNHRILMIGNYLPAPRHNKNVWHFLAEHLTDSGWTVITTSNKENQLLRLVDMLYTIWRKRNAYQIAQVDVFSGKAFIYAILSTRLLKRLNKSIVLTLHGGGLPEFALRHRRAVKEVLLTAETVVTPSAFHQKAFSQIRPDIILIPNPINIQESIYRERSSVAPCLIWVRAFHAVYNPSLAVRVLSLLTAEYPDILLYMLGPDKGDGSLTNTLKLSEELGLSANLRVVGHIAHAEVPRWLDQADIFINTSNYDTAPRSLLEAMANGLCVVSTNVGGVPFMIEEGKNGLLVPPGEPEVMAAAVRKILTDHQLAESLSNNARLTAAQYDWTSIIPQWLTLIQEVSDS